MGIVRNPTIIQHTNSFRNHECRVTSQVCEVSEEESKTNYTIRRTHGSRDHQVSGEIPLC